MLALNLGPHSKMPKSKKSKIPNPQNPQIQRPQNQKTLTFRICLPTGSSAQKTDSKPLDVGMFGSLVFVLVELLSACVFLGHRLVCVVIKQIQSSENPKHKQPRKHKKTHRPKIKIKPVIGRPGSFSLSSKVGPKNEVGP